MCSTLRPRSVCISLWPNPSQIWSPGSMHCVKYVDCTLETVEFIIHSVYTWLVRCMGYLKWGSGSYTTIWVRVGTKLRK